jgi:hypothetical protein
LAFFSNVKVDVIVDEDTMWSRRGIAKLVEDALVEGVVEGPCESWPFLTAE